MAKASYTFLVLSLVVTAALAKPDVYPCTVDMAENSRIRNAFRPSDIEALCVLGDRGDINTDVSACVAKLSADQILGRRVSADDAGYVCEFLGDMVKKYIAMN